METDAHGFLRDLWCGVGCDASALERVRLTGTDPALPGPFLIGAAAGVTIAAAALAAAELWRLGTGRAQLVSVDVRAAMAAFRSERYLRVDGRPPADPWHPVSGFYRGADGRFIQLHCNFPHHLDAVLRVLGCEGTRDAVAAAIAGCEVPELEAALADADACAGMVRPPEEWRSHPQALALSTLPLLEVMRIGEAPAERPGTGDRPLAGVRALDLTRVIAGPVCGRTLAEHGADVMLITAAHLPNIDSLVMDMGRGKLAAWLDLRLASDMERLRALIRECDVFVQSYRPGSLGQRGLGPDEVARLRPGIVYVTLSAYGRQGPWRDRRGFDSLVQSVSGIAHESGTFFGASGPRHLPAQALDHGAGYLAAFGAMVALARRAKEGGSYLVRVSLAQTGRWISGLGRADGGRVADPTVEDVADLLETSDTPFGRLRHVRPAAHLSETPPYWARPSVPLGTHAPEWPE